VPGPYSPALTIFGVAKETVKGTPVAAPADYLRVKTVEPQDQIAQLHDDSLSGSMGETSDIVPGTRQVTLPVGGNVHVDTIMYLVATLLGDVTTTGAGAPFTHAAALKNSGDGQPGSNTFWDYYGIACRQFQGMQCNDLEFTFNSEGALAFAAQTVGLRQAVVAKPAGTPSTLQLVPAYKLVTTIAGSAVPLLLEGSFKVSRKDAEGVQTADGTQEARYVYVSTVTATGKMTLVAEDDTEYSRYLNGDKPTLDFTFALDANNSVVLHANAAKYTDAKLTRGGKYVQTEVEWEGVLNATDAGASGGLSPCKISAKNAKPANTYV